MVRIKLETNKRSRQDDDKERSKRAKKSPASSPELIETEVESLLSEEDKDVEILADQSAPPLKSDFRKHTCPVCLEIPDVMVATECGHIYCNDCIFAALASTRRATKTIGECSVCRSRVRYDKVSYLQMRKHI